MNRKYKQDIYHPNVNVNLTVENVARIKSELTINVGVRVKIQRNTICYIWNITFGILLHVAVKIVKIEQILLMIQ